MAILEAISAVDTSLLLEANTLFPSSTDAFWLAVTKTVTWIPLYVVLLARLFQHSDTHSTWLFRTALIIVGVLIWDQGAELFKYTIARPRPCHDVDGLRVLVHCSPYGFFSAHAANTFGLAFLTKNWLPKSWFPILLVLAIIQSFSRLHLGVHYPLDLLAGALFGAIVARLLQRLDRQFL